MQHSTEHIDLLNEKLKEAEKKVAELQSQLTFVTRQVGVAEIAVGIVHNIGNVLNSVSTASAILRKKIKESEALKFRDSIQKLLLEHQNNFIDFINRDPHGKNFPQYLTLLVETLTEENAGLLTEIDDLEKNIAHIANIVFAQKILTSPFGLIMQIDVSEMIEDAIKICFTPENNKKIKITRQFYPIKPVMIDKIKLAQIITNIIKNGIESLLLNTVTNREMIITIQENSPQYFSILFKDTGIGIQSNNTSKIFSYGFTTKQYGHGLGLHSCENFAKEMGGSLSVESEGVGKGAKFTLMLPYEPPA